MTAIQLSKDWSINPNVRNTFSTLADMSGWFIYENHTWLKAHNWTVKFTSNGTTGPSGPSDTTDRFTNKADASTRGANASSAQSYTVLQNPDGVQLMFAFQGASDDIIRISYSAGGLFTLAGTTTFQPTAADETVFCQNNSVVNATASLDRVMTIWASDDGRAWSNILFRNNALQQVLGFEFVNSACAPGVFTQPYIAYRYNSLGRSNSPGGQGPVWDAHSTGAGATGWFGCLARVFTAGAARLTRCGAGTVVLPNISNSGTLIEDVFTSNTPALQAGTMPLFPWFISGEKAANLDGFLGTPPDWWIGYSSNINIPAQGDFFPGYDPADVPGVDPVRTNWFIALGSTMIRPWKNVAVSLVAI
jgi:hypothetical protein